MGKFNEIALVLSDLRELQFAEAKADTHMTRIGLTFVMNDIKGFLLVKAKGNTFEDRSDNLWKKMSAIARAHNKGIRIIHPEHILRKVNGRIGNHAIKIITNLEFWDIEMLRFGSIRL